MNKFQSLLHFIFNKRAVKPSILVLFFLAGCIPSFAQTVNTVATGVYYKDSTYGTGANDSLYCNWDTNVVQSIEDTHGNILSNDKSFVTVPYPLSNSNDTDPWVSSALIEYDQPYPNTGVANNKYPNHCLGLCTQVACSNLPVGQSTYSIAFPLQRVTFDIFKYYNGKNPKNSDELPSIRSIDVYPVADVKHPERYTCASYHCSNAGLDDIKNSKTAECLGANWICDGTTSKENVTCTLSGSDGSRTISCGTVDVTILTDTTGKQRCTTSGGGITCYTSGGTCLNSSGTSSCTINGVAGKYSVCWNKNTTREQVCAKNSAGEYVADEDDCWAYRGGTCSVTSASASKYNGCCSGAGHSDCVIYDNNGAETNSPLSFCTGWDGFYEIAGEFGKTNGNFGFRATVSTDVPSDGVIADRIEISEMGVYPGHKGATQIPIQVDVTNVHTVRSTPSLVGTITPVSAQPYTFQYRLSKDADVRIVIFDASTEDTTAYVTDNTDSFAGSTSAAKNKIVRTLVDWQPRTGEGMKGNDKDAQISDFDSWDGRHDKGFLLPAGNYIASIQAKSQDEWPGIDFSRAVTRQISLDPLKLTDVRVTGLNKKSTAYATISYVPTESSTVYWEVYTPGTVFSKLANEEVSAVLTNSSTPTGTSPYVESGSTGSLVFRSVEQKTGRMVYTDRWDGTCQATRKSSDGTVVDADCYWIYAPGEKRSDGTICQRSTGLCVDFFKHGAPMPDGNYVYALWAEIPYGGAYRNAAGSPTGSPDFMEGDTCLNSEPKDINNQCFTGVKTLKYTIGNLEVERGLVGITMQPAGYATLGSSPTAYGLDPFIFKYALDRDAQVIATVENTAGVVVKHLTLESGEPNVSQQLNTLTWDGRDDQGRMVYPGTYMFRVKAMDAMFPAQSNEAITVFPVDMYRVVDVATTDVYGDSNAKATISYHLSKPMNVQINIYNKDVVIPNYNGLTGDYDEATVQAVYTGKQTGVTQAELTGGVSITPNGGVTVTSPDLSVHSSAVIYGPDGYRNTWSVATEYKLDNTKYRGDDGKEVATGTYTIYLTQEKISTQDSMTGVWPPHICNPDEFSGIWTASGAVSPALINETKTACIYVNDPNFTNYPANASQISAGEIDVRLQPIHTFDRSHLSNGDDIVNMVEWDALYFYNPTPSGAKHSAEEIAKCKNATEKSNCPYEMLADGQYPFYLSARSNEPFNRYYYDSVKDGNNFLTGTPVPSDIPENVKQEDYLYASDKVINKINVTRGPVYFLEDSVQVYPNAPQLFNASSTTLTFIPPYEINFAISRAATVEAAVVALEPGMCSPVTDSVHSSTVNVFETRNNVAGEICKFLSTMTIPNTGTFDANVIRKLYWDGTDHNGNYVKPGMYEIRLTARNYPDAGLYQPTVKSITISADLLKVFDLLEADNYSIAVRGTDMKIGYQLSVPMKVAIQIFKPGTTIYDYSKGTLRNPATGKEVKDINEVLVRSIVGIRPGTTLIEEVWDGLDYAQQEVPDGVYPFRFVTSLDSARIDSVTGEILVNDTEKANGINAIDFVADTYEYQNLHKATIAIGDGRFVCSDWQKTVLFYPNPLRSGKQGTLEITKMPVPGTVSIKYFNLAGDMVRNADYTCVDANNYQTTMGENLYFQPDNNVSNTRVPLITSGPNAGDLTIPNVRNAALRCKWDATNQHGRKVARGVYFGLVDFKAFNGREHCQKVVKILIP